MRNKYRFIDNGNLCEIFFRDGSSFIIDADDFEIVSDYTWHNGKRGYPTYNTSRKIGRKIRPLHILLVGKNEGMDVDHINGNKMDNRRCNLRICTHQQNTFNQKLRSTNTSGYRGVSKRKTGKYEAYIHCDGKKHNLGLYSSAEEAYEARKKAEIKYFGEYAPMLRGVG